MPFGLLFTDAKVAFDSVLGEEVLGPLLTEGTQTSALQRVGLIADECEAFELAYVCGFLPAVPMASPRSGHVQ